MPGLNHGPGHYGTWVDNNAGGALNLLAEASEIRGGENISRLNRDNAPSVSGRFGNFQIMQQLAAPRLMDVGNDPNLNGDQIVHQPANPQPIDIGNDQSNDSRMAGSDDFQQVFPGLDGLNLNNPFSGVVNEVDDFMISFNSNYDPYPDILDLENFP